MRWSSRVVDPQPVKGRSPPASYTTSVDSNSLRLSQRSLAREFALRAERLRIAISPLIEATYPDFGARLVDLEALVVSSAKAARLSDVAADFALEPPRSTSDLA